jgi:hypothetical protein
MVFAMLRLLDASIARGGGPQIRLGSVNALRMIADATDDDRPENVPPLPRTGRGGRGEGTYTLGLMFWLYRKTFVGS